MKQVYSASITPFDAHNKIDCKSMENVISRNIRHGINGIFILGTMGEWFQLDGQEKLDFIKACSQITRGQTELLVGVADTSLQRILKNIEQAAACDFEGYVVMLPNARMSQVPPVDFLRQVCDAADKPVYYYHAPANNQITLDIEEFKDIVQHPNLKGIKNSAGDMVLRKKLLRLKQKAEFLLFEGQEWAIDEALFLGCDGVVCGIGALGSAVVSNIARAIDCQDYAKAKTLQAQLSEILMAVYGTRSWLGEKTALEALGIISSHQCRIQPDSLMTEQHRQSIARCLADYRQILD